jgi:hypothetical protein
MQQVCIKNSKLKKEGTINEKVCTYCIPKMIYVHTYIFQLQVYTVHKNATEFTS